MSNKEGDLPIQSLNTGKTDRRGGCIESPAVRENDGPSIVVPQSAEMEGTTPIVLDEEGSEKVDNVSSLHGRQKREDCNLDDDEPYNFNMTVNDSLVYASDDSNHGLGLTNSSKKFGKSE